MHKKLPKNWGKVKGTTAFDPEPTYEDDDDRVEEDWETTGQEEMNNLHRQFPNPSRVTVTHVRDRLNNIKDLVILCGEALQCSLLTEIRKNVAHVLYFHVEEQLKIAEEELKHI